MDDYKISLGAILDANAKGDIDKQLSAIKDLSIKISKAELDQNAIDHIKQQLSKNGIDLKLVFGNGSQITNQAKQVGQQIGQQINQSVTESLLRDKSTVKFEEYFKQSGNAAKEAQQYFQDLLKNENATVAVLEKFDDSKLNSFIVNVKRASGEVESLHYQLRNMGDDQNPDMWFKFTGGNINDASAIKQIKDIENAFADYTSKLAQFKSTNSEILSGLTAPLSDFENKLAGLKNGISTIDDVKNAYKALNTEASNITQNFSRQLSPIDSAIRNLAKGEETISGLRAEFKGLNNAPKEINSELNKCARLLENIKKIESQEGRTEKWSQAYREWSNSVSALQSKLNTLRKEQANNTSTQIFNTDDLDKQGKIYIQKVSNTIEKIKTALESKLRKAGYTDIKITGVEKANGQIKSLTASVTDATGAFKKLNFQREKIQGNGKAQYGFVQTDDVKVIGNLSSSIEKVQRNLANLKVKWEEQGVLVGDFKTKVEQLETSLASVGSNNELNKLKTQIDSLKTESANIEAIIKRQESLTNAMAKGREQAELARQAEEKRQELAQNNAINKALEQEYQERQKNIQAAQRQAELDRQNALSFTKSASERLSSAISKYSYGDLTDANAMMKQMNRGLSNFGDLSNVQGNIAQLSSAIDKIISDLKTSHEQSLQALNEEIKAEQTLQSQKDAFNKKNINAIDYEIQKREEEAKAFSSVLQAQMQEEQKLAERANKIQLSMGVNGDTTSKIEVLRNNFTKLGLSADEVKTKMSGVDAEVKTLRSLMNSGADNSAIITQFEKLQTVLTQTQNNLKQTRSDYSLLATEQQRLSLANTIEAWNQKNTAATRDVREENDRYIASLRDLNTEMTKIDFNKINTAFKQNENSMRTLSKLGASLKDQMKQAATSFTQWISVSSAIMSVVYSTKQAVSELKDVNTYITEISKANDQLSKTQLKQIANRSFDIAGKYGKTATNYLSGVQEASRAGYVNAEGVAELSVAAQGAGDMTAELANQYIIATDKAYKFGGSVEKLTEVLDGSNYITNHNAVSMTELAEGMSVVGSQAASSQMSVEETTAAIGTLVAVTQQGGSEMGNAFKGILMNLRQVTGEVEDGGDAIDETSLTKYEKACNELGVSLSTVKDGIVSLKQPMQILKELSEEYTKLDETDARRANLLSAVGGKIYHVMQKCIIRMNLIAGNASIGQSYLLSI